MQNFKKGRHIYTAYSLLKRVLLLKSNLLVLSLIPFLSFSQTQPLINSTLNGKVVDAVTKQGIPGATVQIKGVTHSVQTNRNGGFDFVTGQKFPYTLIISYVGYVKKEIVVNQSPAVIELEEAETKLNDVIIVGYGTQQRKNLVGSVSKIDAEQTKNAPVASFDAQLQGRSTGVQISSNTGMPGEATFIRVRGSTSINATNDPLYIIDGVFIGTKSLQTMSMGGMSTSPLADINPADIESIEVLKDATATAIYGSRGANGVIIVTTKRGTYNAKTKVNVNVSNGFAEVDKSRMWKLVSGPENAAFFNEFWINSGIDNPALNQNYANRPYRPVSEGGRGNPEDQQTYDRLGDVFRTARLENYDLSLQGGTGNTKFYIGGSFANQEAVVKPVYFQRASLKVNLDQKVNDKVTVGLSNALARSYRNQLIAGSTPRGIFQSALLTATNLPKENADGSPALWGGFDNVDVLINNNFINTISLRYTGNIYADVDILPGLKFHTNVGLDYNNYDENQYWNSQTVVGAAPTNGSATNSISQNSSWVNEQTLSYRKSLSKHSLGILIGNTLQSNVLKNTTASGTNFPNNNFTLISAAATQQASQSWTKGNLASFFSRADYNYASKYFIELTVRADGSSRFGKNNRWGYFPSIGGSWRIKEENFLKDLKSVSDLKLRASYGTTGNQTGINDFAALGLWSAGAGYPDNASSGDKPGTSPEQLGNRDLKWEKTTQTSLGIDLGLLDNRIDLTFDVYEKYTTNVLLQLPVPGISGFTSYASNAGEISNKGFELNINSINVKNDQFSWRSSFNISHNRNKIEKLPIPIDNGFLRLQEGSPMYSFYVYRQLYVDPENGNAVYEDFNKDGRITADDRQITGQATPKFFGGFNNNFTYKGFDASVFFSFQTGSHTYNQNLAYGENGGTRADRMFFESQKRAWKQKGDITDLPRITGVGNNYRLDPTDRVLESTAFLRLKTVALGYTLPKTLISKVNIQSIRFYLNATNLWLKTDYSGFDPESYFTLGNDFCNPPQPRSIQFGINLTL